MTKIQKCLIVNTLITIILLVSVLSGYLNNSISLNSDSALEEIGKVETTNFQMKTPSNSSDLSNNSNLIDLNNIFIEIGFTGDLPNNTQIWLSWQENKNIGQTTKPMKSTSSNQAIILLNQTFQDDWNSTDEFSAFYSNDAATLGISDENVIPSQLNPIILHIENLENNTSVSKLGGWLDLFRIRYGVNYVYRTLLHPYIKYGVNCTVELIGQSHEFVAFQSISTTRNWQNDYEEIGTNILGSALVIGLSHFKEFGLSDHDEVGQDASCKVETLLTTGLYRIYYLIEGENDDKYTCGKYTCPPGPPTIFEITTADMKEGLNKLFNETSDVDNAIIMIGTHGVERDDFGNAGLTANEAYDFYSNSTTKWVNVLYDSDLNSSLVNISRSGNVSIFCQLHSCDGEYFNATLYNGDYLPSSILWFYNGSYSTDGSNVRPARAFGTNLNYAFLSVEELFDQNSSYNSPPRWYNGQKYYYSNWSTEEVGSVSFYATLNPSNKMEQTDRYPGDFFLNPHNESFTEGCWERGYYLTNASGNYSVDITNSPVKRWVNVSETAGGTYSRYVGVKYEFTKIWNTDLNVRFNVRATSEYCYGATGVTNLKTRIYDSNGNYIHESHRDVYKDPDTMDTGWNNKTITWPNDMFIPGNSYQILFYYEDGWSYNWEQKIYINSTLTISESSNVNCSTFYSVDFEDAGDIDGDWDCVEETEGFDTVFEVSSAEKMFGSSSGMQKSTPEWGSCSRTDIWSTVGNQSEGTVEGWVYSTHSNRASWAEINILYQDIDNRYYLQFYSDYVELVAIYNGSLQRLGNQTTEDWHRIWWHFKIVLEDNSPYDTITAYVKKDGGSPYTTIGPYSITVGNLDEGYIALRAVRLGSWGRYHYDDLTFSSRQSGARQTSKLSLNKAQIILSNNFNLETAYVRVEFPTDNPSFWLLREKRFNFNLEN